MRKVRDAHAARFNYDLREIYQALKKEEVESGRKFVKLSPKRIEKQEEIPVKLEA